MDEHLSQLTSSRLSISLTREITDCDASNVVFPSKLHGLGLYQQKDDHCIRVAKACTEKEQGVPGFPDFPSFWCGEEGWAVWKRTKATKKEKPKKVEKELALRMKALALKRQPVNMVGMKKFKSRGRKHCWKVPKAKIQQRESKKTERRRSVLKKLKARRQMANLHRSLASLSCS